MIFENEMAEAAIESISTAMNPKSYASLVRTTTKPTEPVATAVDVASDALRKSTKLTVRIQHLVERLTGSASEFPAEPVDGEDEAGGVLPHLADEATYTIDRITATHSALDRLERLI